MADNIAARGLAREQLDLEVSQRRMANKIKLFNLMLWSAYLLTIRL
jgi:hypothetical protein